MKLHRVASYFGGTFRATWRHQPGRVPPGGTHRKPGIVDQVRPLHRSRKGLKELGQRRQMEGDVLPVARRKEKPMAWELRDSRVGEAPVWSYITIESIVMVGHGLQHGGLEPYALGASTEPAHQRGDNAHSHGDPTAEVSQAGSGESRLAWFAHDRVTCRTCLADGVVGGAAGEITRCTEPGHRCILRLGLIARHTSGPRLWPTFHPSPTLRGHRS